MATGLLIAAGIGGLATGVAASNQAQTARRAETRARGLAAEERKRQAEQEKIIAQQEKTTNQQVAARLRATAGRRSGRRSLIFGSEQGVNDDINNSLGQAVTLGG